jgi:hypothetical protein
MMKIFTGNLPLCQVVIPLSFQPQPLSGFFGGQPTAGTPAELSMSAEASFLLS